MPQIELNNEINENSVVEIYYNDIYRLYIRHY